MRVDMNWRAYPFLDYTLAVPPARYLSNWRRSRLSGSGDVRKSHVLMMGLSSGPAVAASREEAEADLNYLLRRRQKTPLYNPFKPSLQGGLDHGRYLECQLSGVYRTGSSPMRTIAICFTRWSLPSTSVASGPARQIVGPAQTLGQQDRHSAERLLLDRRLWSLCKQHAALAIDRFRTGLTAISFALCRRWRVANSYAS
jgi:hypothetical protein